MAHFEKNKYKFCTDIKPNLVGSETIEEREKEIELLKNSLEEYNVLVKDLIFDMASYKIRNIILNISYFIIEDIEIFENMSENKKLPIDKIVRKIPIAKKFLLKWNDYIVTYTIILSNPNYCNLQEYLNIVENVNILGVEEVEEEKGICEHRGIIISLRRHSAIVLTSKGEFKKIKIHEEKKIGEEATGKEKKNIGHYKKHIAIFFGLIFLIVCITIIKYNSVSTTLVIETTSQIKLEVNSFNRVLSEFSTNDKGREMLSTLNLKDEKLDTALYEILKYASSNKMIPSDGVLITVTGHAIEYGKIPISEGFINEENLHIKFNNSGNEHKFY